MIYYKNGSSHSIIKYFLFDQYISNKLVVINYKWFSLSLWFTLYEFKFKWNFRAAKKKVNRQIQAEFSNVSMKCVNRICNEVKCSYSENDSHQLWSKAQKMKTSVSLNVHLVWNFNFFTKTLSKHMKKQLVKFSQYILYSIDDLKWSLCSKDISLLLKAYISAKIMNLLSIAWILWSTNFSFCTKKMMT